MVGSAGIQGHDSIPREVAQRFEALFQDRLPGWTVNGAYNFDARPSTGIAALQLGKNLHFGSHPWINDAHVNSIEASGLTGAKFSRQFPAV